MLRLFCIVGWDWFFIVFVKRENVEFSKEMLSKFCKTTPIIVLAIY